MFNYLDQGERKGWRIEKNDIGLFKTLLGRKEYARNQFFFSLPKVPASVWWRMVDLFQHYANRGLESACCLLYDKRLGEYQILVPPQSAAPCSVDYDISVVYDYLELHPECVWVADFHSHHSMAAFFSCTDDKNERGTRLYGVFGNYDPIDKTFDILLRAGCHGMYVPLDAGDFLANFEGHNSWVYKVRPKFIPEEWLRNVQYPNTVRVAL